MDSLGKTISREKNLLKSMTARTPEKNTRFVTSSYCPMIPSLLDYADGTLSILAMLSKTHTGITKHYLGAWSQIIGELPCLLR